MMPSFNMSFADGNYAEVQYSDMMLKVYSQVPMDQGQFLSILCYTMAASLEMRVEEAGVFTTAMEGFLKNYSRLYNVQDDFVSAEERIAYGLLKGVGEEDVIKMGKADLKDVEEDLSYLFKESCGEPDPKQYFLSIEERTALLNALTIALLDSQVDSHVSLEEGRIYTGLIEKLS